MNVFELHGRVEPVGSTKAEADRYQPGDPSVSNFTDCTQWLCKKKKKKKTTQKKQDYIAMCWISKEHVLG